MNTYKNVQVERTQITTKPTSILFTLSAFAIQTLMVQLGDGMMLLVNCVCHTMN